MWVDTFLSEPLRQAPFLELNRARLLAATAVIVLFAATVFLVVVVPRTEHPWVLGLMMLPSLVGEFLSLVMLRRATAHHRPALLLMSSIIVGATLVSFHLGKLATLLHGPFMVIPMLGVYLVGVRKGLLMTSFLALYLSVIHPFLFHLHESVEWIFAGFTGISLLITGVVSWLFTASRDEAHGALEQVLKTLSESERELSSLLENTEDVVCSLDPRGRIVTANLALRRLSLQLFVREFQPGDALEELLPAEEPGLWPERFQRVLAGERVRFEVKLMEQGAPRILDVSLGPILGEQGAPVGMTLFGKDITSRKEAEARLGEMHRSLLDVSRQAGMAEVATGVLHNVGNALNSANVSAGLVTERLRGLRVTSVLKAAELLREHASDVGAFLASPQGKRFPSYLETLGHVLAAEQFGLLEEMRTLSEGIDHLKVVVNMQQEHARALGVVEQVVVPQLIDDALRLQADSYAALGIQVRRDYAPVPPVLVDRHKLLQILFNLVSNARNALVESGRPDKVLTLRVLWAEGERLRIEVADNGVGVAPENVPRLFAQGFTTRKAGHGFGLHISALAAQELGGSLTCESPGRGQGATFIIELSPGR